MSPEQRDPEQIQEDIDATREELGDTVEALTGKADVKGQAKAKVDSAKSEAKAKVDSAKRSAEQKADELAAKAREATPESVSAGTQEVVTRAQENPVPIAIAGAFAAGVIVGWLLGR